jgi:hypothetical protein
MAKPKQQPAENPPKRRGLAANRRRRRARAVAAPRAPRANPPVGHDITHVLLPGFAAYAGTRVLQRIVYSIVQKRFPRFGKHAHAATGLAAFGAAWFGAHRIGKLASYHDGVLVGTGVAALHGVAQAYLPAKYNWLLADCKPSDVIPTPVPMPPQNTGIVPPGLQGDEYSYLEDMLEEGQPARAMPPPKATRTPVANAMKMATGHQSTAGITLDPDLLDELDAGEDVDDLYSGAFEN